MPKHPEATEEPGGADDEEGGSNGEAQTCSRFGGPGHVRSPSREEAAILRGGGGGGGGSAPPPPTPLSAPRSRGEALANEGHRGQSHRPSPPPPPPPPPPSFA